MSSSKLIDLYRDFAVGINRVYRLEVQSVILVLLTQLCELLSLSPSLWFISSPLPPFPL